MSHEIETFASTQKEWHHHLTGHRIVGEPMTSQQAMELGGIDWAVEKRPCYFADTQGNPVRAPDTFANVRVKDDKCLGIVGKDYKVFQNGEMFEALDLLAADTGEFRYQTAGAIHGGKQVFALGAFTKTYEVTPGDKHENFLFGILDHSGVNAVRFFRTDVRVVCRNTLMAALGRVGGAIVRIPHVGDRDMMLAEARKILALVHKEIDMECAAMRQLASIVVTEQAAQNFLESLFPLPEMPEGISMVDQQVIVNQRDKVLDTRSKVLELHENGRGVSEFPAYRGTAYAWLNAITEYTTWEMDRRDRSIGGQLNAQAVGAGGKLNARAIQLLNRKDVLLAV